MAFFDNTASANYETLGAKKGEKRNQGKGVLIFLGMVLVVVLVTSIYFWTYRCPNPLGKEGEDDELT